MKGKRKRQLIPRNESETVEFKTSFNMETVETLVSFANAHGGTVYVGIDDTGNAVGVSLGKETVPQWINEIKTKTEPSLIPDVEIITIKGKQFVALRISEFPIKPVSVKGKYYKRTGNSNQLLSLNEILNMHLKTFNSSWDYYFDPNHSVMDISDDKTLNLIALYNNERKYPIEKDVFEFLTKMELIRDGKLSNGAFLLLMRNDSILSDIELGYFQNETSIKDGISISTDLITEVQEVLDFLRKHISKEFIITANPARIERWEYPLEALREIVLNMVVHRDYTHHGNSSIKIFPNRIEFFNPGHLPDTISVNDLLQGTYTSECRNKLIAKVFKEINWIERYGTGIRRIRDYFMEYGSPEPLFENFQHGFRVTVYPLDKKVEYAEMSEKMSEKMSERMSERIINLIKNNPEITIDELSVLLAKTTRTIERNLAKLKAKKLLERVGPDMGGYWKVIQNK
ncbi:MAG: putative DNA binding domain-containing protein [Tannerella sp.]|jgi:ATP-dependent DNA helicase RecG|nr:putative DNA binding domain-containing protein [Tannerella sp.]